MTVALGTVSTGADAFSGTLEAEVVTELSNLTELWPKATPVNKTHEISDFFM